MWLICVLCRTAGVLVGMVLMHCLHVRCCAGTLRMDQSEPAEAPYLFLELAPKGMKKILSRRTVTLRVRIEDYRNHSRK